MPGAPEPGAPGARRTSTGRLHSPTRETLLRRIEQAERPVSIAELAAATGWHDNTVRGHVHALWRDGYLARSHGGHAGRGRPSWRWSATPRTPSEPYAALADALAGALERASADPARDARDAGIAWGRALGAGTRRAGTPEEARQRVVEAMRDQGFAPREAVGPPGAVALGQCPLIDAAARHPGVVCTVHLGLVEGLLEAVSPEGSAPRDVELIPFSTPGTCTLRFGAAA
jgi:predicted ArsR family transcriptional regulator